MVTSDERLSLLICVRVGTHPTTAIKPNIGRCTSLPGFLTSLILTAGLGNILKENGSDLKTQ